MKKMTFNKENNKWYIFLPQWEGDKSELEMVSGADRMLDYLSSNTDTVTVDVSEEPIENAVKLKKLHHLYGGADYKVENCPNVDRAWLCKVTKFVYGGYMPNHLYIRA
jgi:hypothetical protein